MRIKSWQRTFGPCEVIKTGTSWLYYTEIRKSGEANGSRMCTRLQKSWSTTPTLNRWHHGLDWDEDQWSGCSSGRSWLLGRDTTRRQPFLWRKALNDDNDFLTNLQGQRLQHQVTGCISKKEIIIKWISGIFGSCPSPLVTKCIFTTEWKFCIKCIKSVPTPT